MVDDVYMKIEYCCRWSAKTLIWEKSMGYEPMIYCEKCNHMQRIPDGE